MIKRAQEFLDTHSIPLQAIEADQHDRSLANYNPLDRTIDLSVKAIYEKAEQWEITPEDFLVLVMAHESGHFYDPDVENISNSISELFQNYNDVSNVDYEKMLLELIGQREKNAWKYGMRLVPPHLKEQYILLNLMNLEYRYCHTKLDFIIWKHNKEFVKLIKKLAKQDKDISELSKENVKLLKENYKLKYGKELPEL